MKTPHVVTIAEDGTLVLHLQSENQAPFCSMSELVSYLKTESIDATLEKL